MSRNALKLMHACINKNHEVSLHPLMTGKPDIKMCIAISTLQEDSTTSTSTNFEKRRQQKKKSLPNSLNTGLASNKVYSRISMNNNNFRFHKPQMVVNHTH